MPENLDWQVKPEVMQLQDGSWSMVQRDKTGRYWRPLGPAEAPTTSFDEQIGKQDADYLANLATGASTRPELREEVRTLKLVDARTRTLRLAPLVVPL